MLLKGPDAVCLDSSFSSGACGLAGSSMIDPIAYEKAQVRHFSASMSYRRLYACELHLLSVLGYQ